MAAVDAWTVAEFCTPDTAALGSGGTKNGPRNYIHSGDLMGFNGIYPLVMTNSLLLNMAISIVSIPNYKMLIFQSYVSHYQRVRYFAVRSETVSEEIKA